MLIAKDILQSETNKQKHFHLSLETKPPIFILSLFALSCCFSTFFFAEKGSFISLGKKVLLPKQTKMEQKKKNLFALLKNYFSFFWNLISFYLFGIFFRCCCFSSKVLLLLLLMMLSYILRTWSELFLTSLLFPFS